MKLEDLTKYQYVMKRDLLIVFSLFLALGFVIGVLVVYDMKKPEVYLIDGRSFDDFISELVKKSIVECESKGYFTYNWIYVSENDELRVSCWDNDKLKYYDFNYKELLK